MCCVECTLCYVNRVVRGFLGMGAPWRAANGSPSASKPFLLRRPGPQTVSRCRAHGRLQTLHQIIRVARHVAFDV